MTLKARRIILMPLSASILVSLYSAWTMPIVDAQHAKLVPAFVLALGLLICSDRILIWISLVLAVFWQQIALDHSMWTLGSVMVTLMLWSNAISILDGGHVSASSDGRESRSDHRMGFFISLLSFGSLTSYSSFLHIEDPIWRSGDIGKTLLSANYLSRFPHFFDGLFDSSLISAVSSFASWILLVAFMLAPILAVLAYKYLYFFYLWLIIFGLFIISSLLFLRLGRLPWVELSVLGFWIWEGRARFQIASQAGDVGKVLCDVAIEPRRNPEKLLRDKKGHDGKKGSNTRNGVRVALVTLSLLSASSLLLSSNYSAVGLPEPQTLAKTLPGMAWRGGRPIYFAGIGPINVFNSEDLNMDLQWRTFEIIDNGQERLIPLNKLNGERGEWLFHDTLYFGNDLQWRREAKPLGEDCLAWLAKDHRLNQPVLSLIGRKVPLSATAEIKLSVWARPELGSTDVRLMCQTLTPFGSD